MTEHTTAGRIDLQSVTANNMAEQPDDTLLYIINTKDFSDPLFFVAANELMRRNHQLNLEAQEILEQTK